MSLKFSELLILLTDLTDDEMGIVLICDNQAV